jgi:hypothetical protein
VLQAFLTRRPQCILVAIALAAAACLLLQWSRPAGRGRLLALAGPAVNWEDSGRIAQPVALAAWSLGSEAPLIAVPKAELERTERAHKLWPGTRRSITSPAFPALLFPLSALPPAGAVEALARLSRLAALLLPLALWLTLPPLALGRGFRGDPLLAALLAFGTGAFTHAAVGGSPALIAACLACGGFAALLRGRDVLAGALFGVAALASECLLLVPVALAVSGRWRAWSATIVAMAAGAGLGLGIGGEAVWLRWVPAALGACVEALREEPLRWLGVAAGAALLAFAGARRRSLSAEALAAAAAIAGMLASPLRDAADGVLLIPAAAILLRGAEGAPLRLAAGALVALGAAMVTGASADGHFRVLNGAALAAAGALLVLLPRGGEPVVRAGRVPALALLACVAGIVEFAGFTTTMAEPRNLAPLAAVYALLVAATLAVARRTHDAPEEPLLPPPARAIAFAGALAGAVAWLLHRTATEVAATPIFYTRADMLPLIQQVARGLLGGTASVYTPFYSLGAWGYECTYWPGLWLPYTLPEALGLDLRTVALAAIPFLALLLAGASGALRRAAGGDLLAALGIVLVLAASPLAYAASRAQTAPAWLALATLLFAIARQRPALAALAVGYLAAARFPMLGLVPVAAIAVWRMERPRAPWWYAMLAALPGLLVAAPLALADPKQFVMATLVRQIAFHEEIGRNAAPFLGLAGVAQALGGRLPGAALLAAGMAGIAAAQWFLARRAGDHLLAAAAFVAVFCLVTPVSFFYYHMKLLIALTAVVLWRPDEDAAPLPGPRGWAPALALAAVALVSVAALRKWPDSAVLRRSANHIDTPELSFMGFRTTGRLAPLLEEPEGAIGFTARSARAGTLHVRLERLDRGPEGFVSMRWNQRPLPGNLTPVEGRFELLIPLAERDIVRGVNTLVIAVTNPDGTPMVGNIRVRSARWEPGPR